MSTLALPIQASDNHISQPSRPPSMMRWQANAVRDYCALTADSSRFSEAGIAVECRQIQEGMMLTASNKSGAIPALTGLRFIAALMVFFSHYPIHGSEGWLKTFQLSGYSGVTFFFILSGFMLTYNYLDSFENTPVATTPNYLLSRVARVYPLYALCVLYAWATTDTPDLLLKHLFLVQAWYGDVDVAMGLNGPAWSISVEALLYLSLPLLIPVLGITGITSKKSRLVVFFFLTLAAIFSLALFFWLSGLGELSAYDHGSAHRWLYRTPVTRLLDFCLGISAAIFYLRFAKSNTFPNHAWNIILACAGIAVIFLMGWSTNYLSSFGWDASYAIPFTLIILGVAMTQGSILSRVLSTKTALLLGEASYAFYLIHTLARGLLPDSADFGTTQTLISHLYFLTLVIMISIAAHLLIEKPARRLILGGKKYHGARVGGVA
ncbi:acyltransferase family protein [Pseudomonas lini]|uniref:acyltransferase family protein n=1 Tax=Pseudomonas lini TaxID=163011 RepID=UPI0018D066AD|nr:acyltransferase [Pseudomonas lini]